MGRRGGRVKGPDVEGYKQRTVVTLIWKFSHILSAAIDLYEYLWIHNDKKNHSSGLKKKKKKDASAHILQRASKDVRVRSNSDLCEQDLHSDYC